MKVFLIPPPALPVPAVKGGAVETLITHLLEENERYGELELVCVSIPDGEAQRRAAQYRHATVHYLPRVQGVRRRLWGPMCGQMRRMGQPAPLDPWYEKVRKLVMDERPDLVIAEGGDLTESAAIARMVGRERTWAHLHMQFKANRQLSDMYGGVLAISRFVADQWQSMEPCRMHLLPNCVDPDKFTHLPADADENARLRRELGFAEDDFVVLYCGRICEEKGVHRLVEAMVKIDDPKVKLLIIGSPFFAAEDDSPFFERMRTEAGPLRQAGRIQFTGYLHNDRLPAYYRLADLACFPAIWEEPAGIVAIEAMACGCPIVATASGGMGEYLTGSGAALVSRDEDWHYDGSIPVPGVEPLDDQLARVIAELKADPAHRARMAQAGIERAKKFSRQSYYRNFVNIVCSCGEVPEDE